MKRNTTYRKNNRTGFGRETDVEHKAVDNHTVGNRQGEIDHTVGNRHNRQVAVAADDTKGVSTAASSVSPATAQEKRTEQEKRKQQAERTEQVKRTEPTKRADLYDNRPLAFTLKNMTDLVIAYEAYRKLEQSVMLLTDTIPDNPILAGLRHIDEIIFDISPVFDDMDEDVEYDTFVKILDDVTMGAEEKAEILMCWSSAGGSSSGSSDPSSTVDDHRVDNCCTAEVKQDELEASGVIPFTLEHMELLLTAYDGYRELQDGLMDLLKMDPEEGVFHSISQLDNLICKLSPIYDRTKNYQDQELGKVLMDDSSPIEERAEKLMGW